jgi:hypothetical protein
MTRHKQAHTGLVTPSPLDRWIDAMLRAFAMLVHLVASTLQMIPSRRPVIGTREAPADLPTAKIDSHQEDHHIVSANIADVTTTTTTPTESFSGLSRESRLAQRWDRQPTVPLIPTKVGTEGSQQGLSRPEASTPCKAQNRPRISFVIGTSGRDFTPA